MLISNSSLLNDIFEQKVALFDGGNVFCGRNYSFGGNDYCVWFINPFGNCQTSSIKFANKLIEYSKNAPKFSPEKDFLINLCILSANRSLPKMMMFDVHKKYVEFIKSALKDTYLEHNYKNTYTRQEYMGTDKDGNAIHKQSPFEEMTLLYMETIEINKMRNEAKLLYKAKKIDESLAKMIDKYIPSYDLHYVGALNTLI